MCTPNQSVNPEPTFWQIFSFLRILVYVKLLLRMTKPTARIGSNELCTLRKGVQFCRGMFIYLKQSFIGCKKFQNVHPKSFLTNFQFLEV